MGNDPIHDATARPLTLRWFGLLAVAFLTTFALLGPGSVMPAYAAAAKTSLAASISATRAAPGGKATVTATLKKGSTPVPRVAVKLQKRTAGTTKWVTVATRTTSSKGKVSAQVTGLVRNTEIRAISTGNSKYKPATSTTRKVLVAQKITITKTTTTTPESGKTITLTGTATPGLVGRTLQLQKKAGTSWAKAGTAKVTSNKTFTFAVKAGHAGKATYRVHVPATASTLSALSPQRDFTIYQWFRLSQIEPIDGSDWDDGTYGLIPDSGKIAGTFYGDVLFDIHGRDENGDELGASWSAWKLGKACKSFTAKVGILDDSDVAASAVFRNETYAGGYITAYGEASRAGGQKALSVTADVVGADHFILEALEVDASWKEGLVDMYAYPAFADAKVLCSRSI